MADAETRGAAPEASGALAALDRLLLGSGDLTAREADYLIVRAALTSVAQPAWRPITPAQGFAEGEPLLLYNADHESHLTVWIGYPIYGDEEVRWYRNDTERCDGWPDPTHWAPLPAPPTSEEKTRG